MKKHVKIFVSKKVPLGAFFCNGIIDLIGANQKSTTFACHFESDIKKAVSPLFLVGIQFL